MSSGCYKYATFHQSKNLPFSIEEVKQVVKGCNICAEIKPQFLSRGNDSLVKATQPMERLSLDFKGPLPSVTTNKYLLIMIDEYSRFPFVFAYKDACSSTVIRCLDTLFSLCGTPTYIHSNNGTGFISKDFKSYLVEREIGSSISRIYHPTGNSHTERTVDTTWKTIQLALKWRKLPVSQ